MSVLVCVRIDRAIQHERLAHYPDAANPLLSRSALYDLVEGVLLKPE